MLTNPQNSINGWEKNVLSIPNYSFFNTKEWLELITESYNYKNISIITNSPDSSFEYFPLVEINSFITGRRAVCLPFSDYCEPLIADQTAFDNCFNKLLQQGEKAKWKYLEIKGGAEFLYQNQPAAIDYGHLLYLNSDEQKLFSSFSSNTKRNIKKSLSEGLKVEISSTQKALNDYYHLNLITRKRHGLPPQPYKFFQNLFDKIIKTGRGNICLVSHDKQIIAGAIYLHFGKKVLYKYGASDLSFQNLRANNLVMWEAIRHYAALGYEEFYFGKTEPENDGLRRFKNGWNTIEYEIKTYRYDFRKKNFVKLITKTHGEHNKYFAALPIPVLKVIGKIAYRHIG
ncbi:MAG TPA: peptidoglycan bridge formation glycyltransferase FemA/FemB family protein [Ignavibacteriaceae bacterium]|nr:peptidoglycan bridge formation glycyltransferase FemA/FemB family protein [Ignavibacteriaceae bacterium]